MPPILDHARAHLRTVLPTVRDRLRPHPAPPSTAWTTTTADGAVLTGAWSAPPDATQALLLVHGLGGSGDAWYLRRVAAVAHHLGVATLRLHLRGADREGGAIYHAGLTEDVHAALADTAFSSFDRVGVVGVSLGGHVVLRAATEGLPASVERVAALSPPLFLDRGADHLDRPWGVFYRRHLLAGLREIYEQTLAHGGEGPVSRAEARRIRTLRAWDDAVVAPWFGFAGAQAYYDAASVGPRLDALTVDALLIHSPHDPLVAGPAVGDVVHRPPPRLTVRALPGTGHADLPHDAALDLPVPGRGTAAVVRWVLA